MPTIRKSLPRFGCDALGLFMPFNMGLTEKMSSGMGSAGRTPREETVEGLDFTTHGEKGYNF